MFIDIAKINLKAGNGGNGSVSFRREKYEPSGGPSGGDGGNGGSVIVKVNEGLKTLMDFKYKKKYKAEPGEDGKNKNQFGKFGKDLMLEVPQGTIIRDGETNKIIADLISKDDQITIVRGGRGGRGNAKFATAARQAPQFSESGKRGEERTVVLELKLIADVGVIGFPNVGKSTLLSVMTDAKPKIANYHFTTLSPNLGVVNIEKGESFVIADIPGLIEGASEGVGLGYNFLRHIERTKVLVHMIDISGQEGRDPIEDFKTINMELSKHSKDLLKKPQIVVANKTDVISSMDEYNSFKEKVKELGEYDIIPISAVTGKGIKELKYKILNELKKTGLEDILVEKIEIDIEKKVKMNSEVIVKKENDVYYILGDRIERIIDSINFEDVDSLRYFQNLLRKLEIIDKLEKLGIEEQDIVNVYGYEFEFFY